MTVSYEDELARSGKIVVTTVGVSMRPLIKQGRDSVMIEKPSARLNKNDVALYKRYDGKYVLHRIVEVRPDDYVFLGDNCMSKEYGIKDDQVIGVMTALVRDGKDVDLTGFGYKFYVSMWSMLTPVRILWKKTIAFLKRIAKKIIRR